ncbi:MAG: carboxypeptidase-like regulatory domain-containing protein [Candidatus Acidiferrales bacterium]
MSLQAIRALAVGALACLLALPLAAAPNTGKISGVVVAPDGTPQLGATVVVSSDQLFNASPLLLLTNDRGLFLTASLPAGFYSIKVTLAGFLPTIEQHIEVSGERTTLLEIVLGSVFSSFEKLRRQPGQQVSDDDWTWVLRTSASTRSVLQFQDGAIPLAGESSDTVQTDAHHGLVEVTSGGDHPGSIADGSSAPGTAFVYDMGLGARQQLLMAGQFSYEGEGVLPDSGFAGEWLPSGKEGIGPATTFVVRESHLGPDGPVFRGFWTSYDDQFALGDGISVRYGTEYMLAGFEGTARALRPHGEVAMHLGENWRVSATVTADPWRAGSASPDALASALGALDAFPTLMVRNGRPLFENDWHEEIAVGRALGPKASVSAAVFRDSSTQTAVIGRRSTSGPDFLQDYFSEAFAYDGGPSGSAGVRVAYQRKFTGGVGATIVYSYAGALAPDENAAEGALHLRDGLATRYRDSLAGRVSATLPHFHTKLTAGYKWLSGTTVSQQDPYGESLYQLDPYLSMEICQPLPAFFPGHMEVLANVGNLLAQGYVSVPTRQGNVVLVPSYRYLRGGLSVQF